MQRFARLVQRLMLRTGDGPLRPLWSLAYAIAIRALTVVLGTTRRGTAVYACGSFGQGEPLYGVSDIDLVAVVPEVPGRPGAARSRVQERWARVVATIPLLGEVVDAAVYEQPALADAVAGSTLTYGLAEGAGAPARGLPSAYFGAHARAASVAVREGPGLFGPLRGWRRLRGPELRPPAPEHDRDERRIAAWLVLQSWWRWTFMASLSGGAPWLDRHSAKLVSEPVRILLWLRHGEQLFGRTELRGRVRALMPEYEEALGRFDRVARDSSGAIPGGLAEALPWLVALSGEIGRWLREDVAAAGTTAVRLLGAPGELQLSRAGTEATARLPERWKPPEILPLADWRARVYPWFVDEAFVSTNGDPSDLADLRDAANAGRTGPYVALASDGLLVLPTAELLIGRGRLRGAECPVTDPVSFALRAGRDFADFPDVPGWSARDSARRAVAEHAACLAEPDQERAPDALAKGLNAARAAVFLESLEEGEPELPITVAATLSRLGERDAQAQEIAEAAGEAYVAWRLQGSLPPEATAVRLHSLLRGLAPYRARAAAGTAGA